MNYNVVRSIRRGLFKRASSNKPRCGVIEPLKLQGDVYLQGPSGPSRLKSAVFFCLSQDIEALILCNVDDPVAESATNREGLEFSDGAANGIAARVVRRGIAVASRVAQGEECADLGA